MADRGRGRGNGRGRGRGQDQTQGQYRGQGRGAGRSTTRRGGPAGNYRGVFSLSTLAATNDGARRFLKRTRPSPARWSSR